MCERQESLRKQATDILSEIETINRKQIEALRGQNDSELLRLDKQLELLFGEKERSFGALRQHREEHGC